MRYVDYYDSPVGEIIMVSDGTYIEKIFLKGQRIRQVKDELERKDLPVFGKLKTWLNSYFNGDNPDNKIPIKMIGTDFQRKVWQELLKVPYGKTVTYEDVAVGAGYDKRHCRAVAQAIGHNPLLIIVPCHRIIGKNGSLTGFAAGLEAKEKLLKIESK